MDLSSRVVTMQMDVSEIYEIWLHEIKKKSEVADNVKIAEQVLKGINLKFNMETYIKGRYKEKVYSKIKQGREIGEPIVRIKIGNQEFLKDDFDDEIIMRVRVMRSWLWENMSNQKVGELRAMALSPGGNNGDAQR